MIKVQLYVTLVLHNVLIKLLNVSKKIKETPNVTTIQSYVMSIPSNVTMDQLNVSKNKRTTECDKSMVNCDISTA